MSSVLLVAEHVKGKIKSATLNTVTFVRQISETLAQNYAY